MQAPIYVSVEAFQTAYSIKDLDYYQRGQLCEDEPGFDNRPGYHLKNANKISLVVLPEGASIVSLADPSSISVSISMPTNLRGCVFEGAPDLPADYAAIVGYWSGDSINTNSSGAAYFQCPLNEYMVDLGPDPIEAPIVHDQLLSEGVVVAVIGLSTVLPQLSPDSYIEVRFPIDPAMLGLEPDAFCSTKPYGDGTDGSVRYEQVYLKVADILKSPDPNRVYIDLLFNELIDYGYWY